MSRPGPLGGIRAVTFDAGGTLLAPHPSVGVIYREVALRHGGDLPEAALDRGFHAAFGTVAKDASVPDPEARERDFWKRVVRRSLEGLEGRPPRDFEAFFADLWETFAHAGRWRLLDGAVPLLETLRGRGFRLGVLSNWDRRLHPVLEGAGLRAFFDAVVISSEAGCEKPDPGIFRVAERLLGTPASACLHIGDSRRHDLAGARGAGWRALLVRHDDGPPDDESVGALGQVADRLGVAPAR